MPYEVGSYTDLVKDEVIREEVLLSLSANSFVLPRYGRGLLKPVYEPFYSTGRSFATFHMLANTWKTGEKNRMVRVIVFER